MYRKKTKLGNKCTLTDCHESDGPSQNFMAKEKNKNIRSTAKIHERMSYIKHSRSVNRCSIRDRLVHYCPYSKKV